MRKALHNLGTFLREGGIQLDNLGLVASGKEIFREPYARHRNIANLFDKVSDNLSRKIVFSNQLI